VSYSAYQNDLLAFEQTLTPGETAGVYVQNVDRTFAAGKKGAYTLKFKAVDKSGTASEVVERVVNIGNDAPMLLDFVHADSVQQPQEGKIVAFLIGNYKLTFYATDFAGNQSGRITRTVTFYPQEGL